ncbi:hypothetical protein HDV00_003924 [Rhizophlyctis rosea]|nr:hypothetical protein HDV00_003924 [Rhizophlyctis rosea]
MTILSGKYTKQFYASADDLLQFDEAAAYLLQVDWTIGRDGLTNPWHKTLLNKNFHGSALAIHEDVFNVVTGYLEETFYRHQLVPTGTEMPPAVITDVNGFMWGLVARAIARFFIGPNLSKNERIIYLFIQLNHTVMNAVTQLMFVPPTLAFFKPYIGGAVREIQEELGKYLLPEISRRQRMQVEDPNWDSRRPADALQMMLDYRYSDGSTPTNQDISNRMCLLIFAAMTTTTFRSWHLLYDVCSNPDLIAELRAEQDTLHPASDGGHSPLFTKETATRTPVLDAAIRESLRLSGTWLGGTRVVLKQDFDFGDGLVIPKGRFVSLSGCFGHWDEATYPEPAKYDHTRHLGKAPTSPEKSFLIFGLGRHACPGRFLATTIMKATITSLVHHYDLAVVKDAQTLKRMPRPERVYGRVEATMKHDLPVALWKRGQAVV